MAPLASREHDDTDLAPPGKVESVAAAVAGPAFAASALLVREATLIPPAMFDASAAILLAVGLAPMVHRRFGVFPATIVRGIGLTAGALLLSSTLVPPFDRATLPLALWIAGATLLQSAARARGGSWGAATLGLMALAGGWALAFTLAPRFPEPDRLRLALLVAAPIAIAGLALRAWAVRRGMRTFAPMPVGLLLVIALGAVYLAYRGLVATRVANLPLYEWTVGVAGASLLLTRLRRHAREHGTTEAWSNDARRHAQDVAPAYDERMGPIVAVVQRYLDRGEGFDAYRDALLRAAPHAPAAYEQALREMHPPQGRARGRAAAHARHDMHQRLTSLLAPDDAARPNPEEVSHGKPEPRLRTHP